MLNHNLKCGMEEFLLVDFATEAVWLFLKLAAPVTLSGMIVGLFVSFLQAITQIQEMTLSFVPKVIVILFMLLFLSPFIGSSMDDFFTKILYEIENLKMNG